MTTHTTHYQTLPVPSLQELHDLLDQHDAWTKTFYEFERIITLIPEDHRTTHINYDDRNGMSLKDKWEILQYTRKFYSEK